MLIFFGLLDSCVENCVLATLSLVQARFERWRLLPSGAKLQLPANRSLQVARVRVRPPVHDPRSSGTVCITVCGVALGGQRVAGTEARAAAALSWSLLVCLY